MQTEGSSRSPVAYLVTKTRLDFEKKLKPSHILVAEPLCLILPPLTLSFSYHPGMCPGVIAHMLLGPLSSVSTAEVERKTYAVPIARWFAKRMI